MDKLKNWVSTMFIKPVKGPVVVASKVTIVVK